MARRRRARGRQGKEAAAATVARSAYASRLHPDFVGSLDALGTPMRQRILGVIKRFMEEFISDAPITDVYRTWSYKLLRVAGAREAGVHQITVLKDYRVAVTVRSKPQPEVWFLHVYRRVSKMDPDYAVAVHRANRIGDQ